MSFATYQHKTHFSQVGENETTLYVIHRDLCMFLADCNTLEGQQQDFKRVVDAS